MKSINEYKNRFNQLLESTMGNVKPLISEKVESTPNVNLNDLEYEVISEGKVEDHHDATNILKSVVKGGENNQITLDIIPNRFDFNEKITIKIIGDLKVESSIINNSEYSKIIVRGSKPNIQYFMIELYKTVDSINIEFNGNVDGGKGNIILNMKGSSVKP
jgi:hypothetical protein